MQLSLYNLSSSQLTNLRATPVEVIPPQGSGLYITPFIITLRSRYGTVPYGNLLSTYFCLQINGQDIFPNLMNAQLLGETQDSFINYIFSSSFTSNLLTVSGCDNQGIYLRNTDPADLINGDGTLDVQIAFEVNNV